MKILVSGAAGKTGRHVIEALRARAERPALRGVYHRRMSTEPDIAAVHGDLDDPTVRAAAVQGVDAVIHYGPTVHPREKAMGTGMIDAAVAAGVRRFVFISVLHPEIDDLVNHQAKLAIEAYLINSGLDWTVLRPQHYMQNIDVARVVREGRLVMPYPVGTTLGHVDLRDLAEAAAKVALEPGHSFATYDLAANVHLSVTAICEAIGRQSGQDIAAVAITTEQLIEAINSHMPGGLPTYSVEAFHRLFGYYGRKGIRGNPNVLTWLLGRPPADFESYVRRSLAGDAGAVGMCV